MTIGSPVGTVTTYTYLVRPLGGGLTLASPALPPRSTPDIQSHR